VGLPRWASPAGRRVRAARSVLHLWRRRRRPGPAARLAATAVPRLWLQLIVVRECV